MSTQTGEYTQPADSLSRAFMLNFPADAARQIETMTIAGATDFLRKQPTELAAPIFEKMGYSTAKLILLQLPPKISSRLLSKMDTGAVTVILSQLDDETRDKLLSHLHKGVAAELRSLLEYPDDVAGKIMETRFLAFNENITVNQALTRIKKQNIQSLHHLFLLNDDMCLISQVDIQRIALADGDQKLSSLSIPVDISVQALDPKTDVIDIVSRFRLNTVPVIDVNNRLVGIIEGQGLIDALREDIVTNMQTMVGVSKDERALSSSWFAVKKRLPWLQINLLTAFLAAAVVGLFEATIAKYTALAILLPIAAGQSGNTGAQALAVTMRGLTLREVTTRHWLRVAWKETIAALVNGLAIAITCGIGVYIWSNSYGLSLIIALAMISSMTIAAVSGALVPMALKKLGQDPALSSSIILTTITDIAGFMSFLGIATSLAWMLEAG